MPNRLTSRTKARIISGRDDALLGLHGAAALSMDIGSVLAFCEAVFWRSEFATRCWFTALSVVMGQCWLSVRLFFGGQHSRPRCWFTALAVVMGECWLSVRLFFGGQHSRRDVGFPHSQW